MDWFPLCFLNYLKSNYRAHLTPAFQIQPQNHLNGNKLDWSTAFFISFHVWKICREEKVRQMRGVVMETASDGQARYTGPPGQTPSRDWYQDPSCACMDQDSIYSIQNFKETLDWFRTRYQIIVTAVVSRLHVSRNDFCLA